MSHSLHSVLRLSYSLKDIIRTQRLRQLKHIVRLSYIQTNAMSLSIYWKNSIINFKKVIFTKISTYK